MLGTRKISISTSDIVNLANYEGIDNRIDIENECFILDEPFNGVDINIILTEIILKLKELNMTVLVSSELSDTCDEIFKNRESKSISSKGEL